MATLGDVHRGDAGQRTEPGGEHLGDVAGTAPGERRQPQRRGGQVVGVRPDRRGHDVRHLTIRTLPGQHQLTVVDSRPNRRDDGRAEVGRGHPKRLADPPIHSRRTSMG